MKRMRYMLSLAATAGVTSLAVGQQNETTESVEPGAVQRAPLDVRSQPRTRLASDLLGEQVRGTDGTIGEIADLVIEGQEIVAVAVDVGGVLGLGERRVALAFEDLGFGSDGAISTARSKSQVAALAPFEPGAGGADEAAGDEGRTAAPSNDAAQPSQSSAPLEPLEVDPELSAIDPRLAVGIASNEAAYDEKVDTESFDNDADESQDGDAPPDEGGAAGLGGAAR